MLSNLSFQEIGKVKYKLHMSYIHRHSILKIFCFLSFFCCVFVFSCQIHLRRLSKKGKEIPFRAIKGTKAKIISRLCINVLTLVLRKAAKCHPEFTLKKPFPKDIPNIYTSFLVFTVFFWFVCICGGLNTEPQVFNGCLNLQCLVAHHPRVHEGLKCIKINMLKSMICILPSLKLT